MGKAEAIAIAVIVAVLLLAMLVVGYHNTEVNRVEKRGLARMGIYAECLKLASNGERKVLSSYDYVDCHNKAMLAIPQEH